MCFLIFDKQPGIQFPCFLQSTQGTSLSETPIQLGKIHAEELSVLAPSCRPKKKKKKI